MKWLLHYAIGIAVAMVFNVVGQSDTLKWYKGQLHCHSTNSGDGVLSIEAAVNLYKNYGYNFLFMTDHNYQTDISKYSTSSFVGMKGVEITTNLTDQSYHVNAYNPKTSTPSTQTLQGNVQSAINSGADFVQIDHPYDANLSAADIIAIKKFDFLEVFNAKDPGGAYDEGIWDSLLSRGRIIYGTGNDDFHDPNASPSQTRINWVMLQATELTPASILQSLKSGDFNFCTKKYLIADINRNSRSYTIYANEKASSIVFKGKGGIILATATGDSGTVTLAANQPYVRAIVKNSSGAVSCSQPYFPDIYGSYAPIIKRAAGHSGSAYSKRSIELNYVMGKWKDSIASINWFADSIAIGASAPSDSSFIWSYAKEGTYRIKARAVTKSKLLYWSNIIEVKLDPTFSDINSTHSVTSAIKSYYQPQKGVIVRGNLAAVKSIEIFNVKGRCIVRAAPEQSTSQLLISVTLGCGIYLMRLFQYNNTRIMYIDTFQK